MSVKFTKLLKTTITETKNITKTNTCLPFMLAAVLLASLVSVGRTMYRTAAEVIREFELRGILRMNWPVATDLAQP
jgi:hypothetical protein